MQIWDSTNPDYVEQVRWVLNYTFPARYANFTMQHSFVNNTPNVSTSGGSFAPGSNPMGTIEEEENADSTETVDGESTDEEFLVEEEPKVVLP